VKRQQVTLMVTVADDASDPDILVPDVLDACFIEAGANYAVELVHSGEVEVVADREN
jgi:hypothetical protein